MAVKLQYASKGCEKWAQQVVLLAKANLVRGKKIAAGTLYNSVSYTFNPATLEIDFFYEDYGEFVESGRKPGRFPPPRAIAKWARIKGLPQFRDKKGRYISNDSRAFLLSRAIAKKGIRPFPFFTDAIEDSITQLSSELEANLAKDLEDIIEI
jgi:hypothetical protein